METSYASPRRSLLSEGHSVVVAAEPYSVPGTGVVTAQPVTAGTTASANRGCEWLSGYQGLFLRQHIELLEVIGGCETKNRYQITPISTPLPASLNSGWAQEFREAAAYSPLLTAKEESDCCERVCCPMFRGFTMDFKDVQGISYFRVERPFVCDPCYCQPCCSLYTQNLRIVDANGHLLGSATEVDHACGSECCARSFVASDANGKPIYKLRASDCGTHDHHNCCAPSCLNEEYAVDVFEAGTGEWVGQSSWVWPGCNCGGLTDRSNMATRFPAGSSDESRATLLAGLMLVEYAVHEYKQAQQKNNGGGGGGGGGAPPAQQMVR